MLTLVFMTALSTATNAGSFDGGKWNVSTGNLSVTYIQHSPIGHLPQPGYYEEPPSVESLKMLKENGLVAYEDYVAWGAVEQEKGKWNWAQHDKVCANLEKAGLKYVVYNWTHFPPVWLRESDDRTLMRCVEHKQNTNYLSIYDPKTIEYYDHFYKELAAHFGDRIDGVYACILGPYGEGNYPLYVPDFIDMGHCHEGYWCEDPYALSAFRDAMRKKYDAISTLNAAWGTDLGSFTAVRPPKEIVPGFTPTPDAFKTGGDRRRWLDFITWYHQAIIDFAEDSIRTTLKYFPKEKVRTKPGGTAHGVNPVAWGTYSPGYAKMAAKYGIVMQPADCIGAYYGDKWLGTAYRFYGVPLSTEPAGGVEKNIFVRRMFSDASIGATQLFTYEYEQHAPEIKSYIHLFNGEFARTELAFLCPTTNYRLGADLGPTLRASYPLRELTDFDVLDELLIQDGALDKRYKTLLITQGDFIDQPILDKIERWTREGGTLVICSAKPIRNVEGNDWALTGAGGFTDGQKIKVGRGGVIRFAEIPTDNAGFERLYASFTLDHPMDGKFDGLVTTVRDSGTMLYNGSDKPLTGMIKGEKVVVPPHAIVDRVGRR